MTPVPPCPPVVIVAPDTPPLPCDLDGSQLLVEVGGTPAECDDAGGVAVTLVTVTWCVDLDY